MAAFYWFLGIIIFLIVITVSVALHEFGHLSVAKLLKIPVPRYFVGFGPTLWSKKYKGTEYGIKTLPLGGFIQVEDVTQPEDSPERQLLSYVNPFKRIAIFLAGPIVNLVLGFVILFSLLVTSPTNIIGTTVSVVDDCKVSTNCGAYQGGVKVGDRIVAIDGKEIKAFSDMVEKFSVNGSSLIVLRDGEEVPLKVFGNDEGKIGIGLDVENRIQTPYEASITILNLFEMNINAISTIPEKMPNVVNSIIGVEDRDKNSISSIVGVGKIYGQTTNSDAPVFNKVQQLVYYSALLNLGLGLANLMPLLPLDGGRILIALIDSVKLGVTKLLNHVYKPLQYKWIVAMTSVTGLALISFMLLIVVADIVSPIT